MVDRALARGYASSFLLASPTGNFHAPLVSTLLETHYGQRIEEVVQDLCAVPLPTAVARSLGVEPQAAGLRVTRVYRNPLGEVVEVSVTHHPAERFSLRTRLTRAAG